MAGVTIVCRVASPGIAPGSEPRVAGGRNLILLEARQLSLPWPAIEAFAPEALVFASGRAAACVAAATIAPAAAAAWARLRARAPIAAVGAASAAAVAASFGAPAARPPDGPGLSATLAFLGGPRAAVFGAAGGKAERTEHVFAVACYDLIRPSNPSARVAEALASAFAAPGEGVVLDVGSASLATVLCDSLPDPLPVGLKFLPRHASARAVLLSRLSPSEASTLVLPVPT